MELLFHGVLRHQNIYALSLSSNIIHLELVFCYASKSSPRESKKSYFEIQPVIRDFIFIKSIYIHQIENIDVKILQLLNIFFFLFWKNIHYLWPLQHIRAISFKQRREHFPELEELDQDSRHADLFFGADTGIQSTFS